jgi:hypothetical protein
MSCKWSSSTLDESSVSAGWTRLVAEMKLSMAFRQLCREPPYALRVGIDLSPITDLAVPPIFRNCHRVSRFGYI